MSVSGFGADAYAIIPLGRLKPYAGAGFHFVQVDLTQDFTNRGSGTFTGESIDATGSASGPYVFAGLEYFINKQVGIQLQFTAYTLDIDSFELNKSFQATSTSGTQEKGSDLEKLNSAGTGYDEKYTADLTRSEITLSAVVSF